MSTPKDLSKELFERFGWISGNKHPDRVHISGMKLVGSGPEVYVDAYPEGSHYLLVHLDPVSPFGLYQGRYCIPFVLRPDFHLDKCTLFIYPVDEKQIRIEVKVPEKRLFSDQEDQTELVYGIQIKAGDCQYLIPMDESTQATHEGEDQ